MPTQQLPHEILEDIFRKVAPNLYYKRDLYNCALVCQSWYLPACHILYEKIGISKAGRMLHCLAKQKQNKGAFCKVLKFDRPLKEILNPTRFKKLLSYLPNLQTFSLHHQERAYELKQLKRNASLIESIKEISFGRGDWLSRESQAYYDCAITFKDSLQNMRFSSFNNPIFAPGDRAGNMPTFLLKFTCLTQLEIGNFEGRSTSLPELCMFPILRACPNLISFSLYNEYQEPEDDYGHPFDHGKLKYLDIEVPEITQQHINYLVTNIKGLKRFKVKSGRKKGTNHKEWMEKIGPDLLDRLQEYLLGIEKVDYDMSNSRDRYSANIWPFVCGIINNKRSTPTHVSMKMLDEGKHTGERTSLHKRKESIFVHQVTEIRELIPDNRTMDLPSSFQLSVTPPVLNEYEVRSYDIHIDSKFEEKETTYMLCLKTLDSVINHFPALNNFNIRIGYLFEKTHYQIKVCSEEMNHNKEYNASFSEYKSILDLPSRRALDSEKFAYVTIQNIRSAAEISSVLKLLPNTKYLKVLQSYFDLDCNFNFTLDLCSLHLRQLYLDISSLVHRGYDEKAIVLQIKEETSNETTCFKWKRKSTRSKDLIFEAVETAFVKKFRRFSSPNFNIISIKCHTLEQIVLYANFESTCASPITTLNLLHKT